MSNIYVAGASEGEERKRIANNFPKVTKGIKS